MNQIAERVLVFIVYERNEHSYLPVSYHDENAAPHVKEHVHQGVHGTFFIEARVKRKVGPFFNIF